jgi:hypothetical protein
MVLIVGNCIYPSHKQAEFVKAYIKVTQKYKMEEVADDRVGCVTTSKDFKGIRIMNIWEPKKGKIQEALMLVGKVYFECINIEGFEYTVDIMYTGDEALQIAGVKLPE